MAASKQLLPFLLVDQAQKLDTGVKFWLSNRRAGTFESALKDRQNESNFDTKKF